MAYNTLKAPTFKSYGEALGSFRDTLMKRDKIKADELQLKKDNAFRQLGHDLKIKKFEEDKAHNQFVEGMKNGEMVMDYEKNEFDNKYKNKVLDIKENQLNANNLYQNNMLNLKKKELYNKNNKITYGYVDNPKGGQTLVIKKNGANYTLDGKLIDSVDAKQVKIDPIAEGNKDASGFNSIKQGITKQLLEVPGLNPTLTDEQASYVDMALTNMLKNDKNLKYYKDNPKAFLEVNGGAKNILDKLGIDTDLSNTYLNMIPGAGMFTDNNGIKLDDKALAIRQSLAIVNGTKKVSKEKITEALKILDTHGFLGN